MWQMFLAIADQLQEQNVDEIIIAKVEQDRQINSRNTVKKQVSFVEPFEEAGCTTQFTRSYFHLRKSTKSWTKSGHF